MVAVGDNLIHPVVYNDALQQDGSFNFKPMYLHIKNDIQSPDLAFINQESPLGGMIAHFQDLRTSILRVRLLKMLSKPDLIW